MAIIIPHDQLLPSTLNAVIEEFVTRNGAVHGHADVPMEQSIAQVQQLLCTGKAIILYDEAAQTCTIALKEQQPPPPQDAADDL